MKIILTLLLSSLSLVSATFAPIVTISTNRTVAITPVGTNLVNYSTTAEIVDYLGLSGATNLSAYVTTNALTALSNSAAILSNNNSFTGIVTISNTNSVINTTTLYFGLLSVPQVFADWTGASSTGTTSGTGTTTVNGPSVETRTGTGASARAQRNWPATLGWQYLGSGNVVDWSKGLIAGFSVVKQSASGSNGTYFLRYAVNSSTSGVLSGQGFGLMISNQNIYAMTYNTNLTISSSLGITPACVRITVKTIGDGIFTFYTNGVAAVNQSGGPKTTSAPGLAVETLNYGDLTDCRYITGVVQLKQLIP